MIPVYHYAITFPQLVAQAVEMRLDDEDMVRLRTGYDLAERMFDGLYRSHGSAFINHLVRTASIVMAHGGNVPTALAAMFHAAYMLDYFIMSRRRGFRPADRTELNNMIGPDAEEIVWEYTRLTWGKQAQVEDHLQNLDTYSPAVKSALVIRLANELEDFLDLAMLYRQNYSYGNRIAALGKPCIDMAHRLGMSGLGDELKKAFEATAAGRIPATIVRDHIDAYELPRRHYHEIDAVSRALSGIVRRLKRRISKLRNARISAE